MSDIDMLNLVELRRIAEAATPGPWEAGDVWVYTDPIYADDRRLSDVLGMTFADEDRAEAEHARGLRNADHIAASNPTIVLALLDRIEALEAERDRLKRDWENPGTAFVNLHNRAEAAEARLARVTGEAEIAERRAEHAYKILDRVTDSSTRERIYDSLAGLTATQRQAYAANVHATIRAVAADEQEAGRGI